MSSASPSTGGQENPQDPTSPRRGGRGRGRGRGAQNGLEGGRENYGSRERGRGGGFQAGRGRGGRGNGNRDGGGGRGGRVLEKGKAPTGETDEQGEAPQILTKPNLAPPTDEDDDAEVCFICASPVQHTAVAPCNHRTCHICSIRMRALYKTKACAHCRTESDHVILTDDHEKSYHSFSPSEFFKSDDNLGIHFEKTEIFEDARLLLQYNCPDGECDVACLGWPDLHRHTKTAHGKVMCDLCTRNKKVFTHEHELFTYPELKKHQKFGDDDPGAIDQSGFKGHPECGFCRERFYGDDELYAHCRDKHERCHICDRRDGARQQQQQYYVNYDALEVHFRKDHFLCPDRECMEKKFVVFDSEMDIKAHQLEAHPNGLSKDALRDARRVDMSGFQFRAPHEPEAAGRRNDRRRDEGRGRGRGRDPNAEPLPASSAQPLTRAELAYQRQMEAQNSHSVTGRAFGGQLTADPTPSQAFAARPSPSASEPATVTASRPTPTSANNITSSIRDLNLNAQAPNSTPQTPQEQARLLRHNAVTERASNMLRNDQTKLQEFRSQISAYRTSKVSATQLIEGFFALFDNNAKELGKLVKELAEIFEIDAKRQGLLKAWSDWKAINEDYPSLPGSATGQALNGATAAHGGSRVLKLKSSTAQSSRSTANRQASWSSASSSSTFPALPAAASANRVGAKPGQTPWASSSGTSARASPMPSRTASSTGLSNKAPKANLADGFPALPAAAKPTSTIFSPGYTGLGLRRDNSGRNTPTGNAWGAGEGSGSTTPAAEDASAGKKKGNKNKKQTLFHFG
ncbi:hypothetical protein P153DRAFT_392666 [Dothidotthia symphoricarpi CBS 119687]|uniref:RING-type E3 ubiquitin transferase n=1 Tax=Dothidotthia symphoricarpi CBS 119687 TaxID=1392245 RepID=A0A6A6AR84_9PLEO|nr:uncharacterized protein P153DRAFT_392666 [Dothidotthia symphoricarpi CBS 119687]KAF2134046.1 hypothetical protein P153DRAFT_392666 [Dothidotthia symphoricarpi CBS 119687]